MEYQLRKAAPQDVSAIHRLCVRLYEDADLGLPPVDHTKVLHQIVHAISEGLALVLGGERDGRRVIAGTLGLQPNADWFSSEASMRELWIYVLPEFRSFRAARMLISAGHEISAEHGMTFRMGIFGGKDLPRKIKLYERLGLRPAGVLFTGE